MSGLPSPGTALVRPFARRQRVHVRTSDAIASSKTVNGIPAIRTQVRVNGKYSVTATIRRGLKPTTYAIAGSYNGTPLDTVAWITVRT